MVKKLPANAGDMGSTLGGKDPLETKKATHSSILVWEMPWTEDAGELQSMGSQNHWTGLSDSMTAMN